jgi:methylated-DNA-[protein]-cysteine S-methyltransferase
MQIFTQYIESPVGQLEISAGAEAMLSLHFVGAEKKTNYGRTETTTNAVLEDCKQQLSEYFEGKRKEFDLLYDLEGTVFQQKVWMELNDIAFGTTISYLELARRLGDVKCIRAAGTANGNNPLSIILPCHRVIGSDGKLVGYGGDLWRKEWLLKHEMKFTPKNDWQLF